MKIFPAFTASLTRHLLAAVLVLMLVGCTTAPSPRGIDYPAPATVITRPAPPTAVAAPQQDWRAAGPGLDANYERSALLTTTFYSNPDVLLKQVERSGAMGINRSWEAAASKGDWYIEEQRFADTVIGAGVNRNRDDLIDAGLRAIEWGFARQSADGSFPCKDNYLSSSYFVSATAHALWLLEATGHGQPFAARIQSIRPRLHNAATWLADSRNAPAISAKLDAYGSRYFVTGYALAATGRLTGDNALASAGEETIRRGIGRQHASGYFYELGGFDASFQAEALVYLLRFFDHAATADMRRGIEPSIRLALDWLASRVSARGIVQTTGNTRSGIGKERDRTGQPRRVSGVAVSRAFGLGRVVLGTSKYEALAKSVATARQPA
ncbi:MAG: hypothetical protein ABIZ64_11835 [Casimicrobium sp.]